MVAALLTAVIAAAPAQAAQTVAAAVKRSKVEAARAPVAARVLGNFTPSIVAADGATARAGSPSDLRAFRFTPSADGGANKGVSVGVRARPLAVPDARRGSDGNDGYDVGVAVAARGVALTGGATQLDTGLARREAVTMGLGYGKRDWAAQVRVGEEREDVRGAARVGPDRRYSVELGGALTVSPAVSVGAGVRYRAAPEARGATRPEDRAAYVGVGVKF